MKKIVVGMIIGAVLMYSGQAVATSISKIGKKVQGEYTIKVDGKKLDAKALSIDGQTTVPGRALAEAVGYNIAFENKEVILTKKESDPVGMDPIDQLKEKLNEVEGQIYGVEQGIRGLESTLKSNDFNSEEAKRKVEDQYSDLQKQLEELQKKKAELEAQLK